MNTQSRLKNKLIDIRFLGSGLFLVAATALHAQTIYIGPAVGNWDTGGNWVTGSAPVAGEVAVIDARAQNSTVTISPNLTRSVLGLSVGTGDAVVMSNNSTLIIGGTTLDIDGTLRIDAGANGTDLRIDGAAALDGTGSLLLGGTSNNSRIIGAGTLTNTATIAGRGNIGANQLSLVNAVGGLVDANVNAAANSGAVLFLDPRNGDGFSNQGVMQASNGGLLQLYGGFGGAFNNAGGIIRAVGANSEVQLLSGASVTGGTLQTSGGGLIRGNASQTYHFADLTIDVGTQVRADNNSNLGVLGTITNTGTITIAAGANATDIGLQGNTTFAGSGAVVLTTAAPGSNNARIAGAGTLTNAAGHTIRGQGNIGTNSIGVVNNGTISADVPSTVLFLDPSNAGNFDNNATLQAVGGSILQLYGGFGGAFDNAGGTIQAVGTGSEVHLISGASVTGGTLHTEGGGLIRVPTSQSAALTSATLDAGSQVQVDNNATLQLAGSLTTLGTDLVVAAGANATDLEILGNVTFGGDGSVSLKSTTATGNNARIRGSAGNTLTNAAGHTIHGRGNIGANTAMVVINHGTISADDSADSAVLFIDPGNGSDLQNRATMQAVGGGLLQLYGGFGGAFDNAGGTIQAVGTGSEVHLISGASVTGGTLHTQGGGLIRVPTSQTAALTSATLDAGSQVQVDNNALLQLAGSLTTLGTDLVVAAGANATDIEILGNVTFGGDGSVSLESTTATGNNARIRGSAGNTLTNAAGHTIHGRGNIGANTAMVVINHGTISADDSADSAVLFIDPGNGSDLQNRATMQAVGGGLLQLYGGFGGAFDNAGGTIQAVGAGSEVQLISGASVTGGTLHTEGGGLIRGAVSQSYFFNNVTFDVGTQVQADNNSAFGVIGTLTNNGSITIASGANATDIVVQSGGAALVGSGEVVLGGAGNARIVGGGQLLTNGSGHTIRGRGNIGANNMAFFNAVGATVDADVAGAALFLDPVNGVGTFDNRGLMESSNGGILQFSGGFGGSFDNTGGTIRAGNNSEVQLLNSAGIDGGNWESVGSGVIRLLASQTAAISNAAISGAMQIENNSNLTLSGEILHSGELTINSGGNATDLIVNSILNLQGGGSIKMANNNARILGAGVLINRDHLIHGAGQIGVNQGAVTNSVGGTIHANVAGAAINIDPNAILGFVNDGRIRASGGSTLNLSGSGGGQFTFGESSVVEALDGGTITHSSGAVLTNNQGGTLEAGIYRAIDEGNGATLALPGGNIDTLAANTAVELSGAGARFGQLSALSQNDGSLTLTRGASLSTSGDFTQSANGTLGIGISGKPAGTGRWSNLIAAGNVALGGILDVFFNIGNTFTAAVGDAWKILTGATRTGEFADVNFAAEGLPANSELSLNYLADGVEVEIVQKPAPLLAATTTYLSWAANLADEIDPDPAADADGDGASNLQEYAFAMDPMSPDADLLPQPELVRTEGQAFAAIRYSKWAGSGAPSDIAYVVEQSADLENWEPADVERDSSLDDANQIETINARCLNSLTSSSGQCSYLRVSLERR